MEALSTSIAFESPLCGNAMTGTEKDMVMTGSPGVESPLPASDFTCGRALDTHLYIVGGGAATSATSSSSPSPWASGPGRSSAVESALRLPLARDCFFSKRLMVSAWTRQHEFVDSSSQRRFRSNLLVLQLLLC